MHRPTLPVITLLIAACSSPAPSARLPDAPDAVFGALVLNLSASESLVALDVPVPPSQTRLLVYATEDAGATWAAPLVVDGVFGAWAHEGSEVWLASHVQRAGVVAELRRSTDAGRTWSLVDVESAVGDPQSMVQYDAVRVRPEHVAIRRNGVWLASPDAGTTWETTAPQSTDARPPTGPCRVGVEQGVLSLACDAGQGWELQDQFSVFRP